MALILTDDGGKLMLDIVFGDAPKPTSQSIELFTDSNAVTDQDGGGIPRTLATGGGYAEIDLTTLANSVELASGIPVILWEDAVWTFTGPLTGNPSIKGYMVLLDSVVVHEELLPSPYTPTNAGDKLTISPQFKLGNGTPT